MRVGLLILCIALANCAPSPGPGPVLPPQEDIVREVVREAVKASVAEKFPNVPTEKAVDCIIDNASDEEIKNLANAKLLDSGLAAAAAVAPILQKPETLTCLSQASK